MSMNRARARDRLAKGDLHGLFIEELGWDRYESELQVTVEGRPVLLRAVAQKRGMVVYQCFGDAGQIPVSSRRRKIEQQVAKAAHEHFIVFSDSDAKTQIWQWVKREPGKPTACREHEFRETQPGDALLQKLDAIACELDEEERLLLPEILRRARAGFDVERVSKRFYDRFQSEHEAFLSVIEGIPAGPDREWYASVMLNRLMFVYFIQRKGFLDGDCNYLRNRLEQTRAARGRNSFHSFYRYFLLRLFHEGLGGEAQSAELERFLGRIPYVNGGLFAVHELEKTDRYGAVIEIPDEAFVRVFDFFDAYQWHLDERPVRADNEINPDVLGFIFERYVNQKQMGAYYTKEDITEYIARNTVVPFVLDAARLSCSVAFDNVDGPSVWDLLREAPDRYVYPSVRSEDNLPTETDIERTARRRRYDALRRRLAAGEVRDIDELVTLNVDIRQFAQDVVESCEWPDLLRACWQGVERVTILDPTCGSGAFLFAALNVLEQLYEAILDRMAAFLGDLERSTEKRRDRSVSTSLRHLPAAFSDSARLPAAAG